MSKPEFIESKDWERLTDRQRKTMIERGESHLNHMRAWLRSATNPRKDKGQHRLPGRAPKPSQWYNPPSVEPVAKDHQY